jgi:hypothetical protein
MRAAARIALGILLGLVLATLPFAHYRFGAHDDGADTGGSHAHHTH